MTRTARSARKVRHDVYRCHAFGRELAVAGWSRARVLELLRNDGPSTRARTLRGFDMQVARG